MAENVVRTEFCGSQSLKTHLVAGGGEMLSNLLVHFMDILLFIRFACLLGRHDALVVNNVGAVEELKSQAKMDITWLAICNGHNIYIIFAMLNFIDVDIQKA